LNSPSSLIFTSSKEHRKLWLPLFYGCSELVFYPRLEIRMRALQCLFGTLRAFGESMDVELWKLIFNEILFPLFDKALVRNSNYFSFIPEYHISNMVLSPLPLSLRIAIKVKMQIVKLGFKLHLLLPLAH
jgi:hypothetical protein